MRFLQECSWREQRTPSKLHRRGVTKKPEEEHSERQEAHQEYNGLLGNSFEKTREANCIKCHTAVKET